MVMHASPCDQSLQMPALLPWVSCRSRSEKRRRMTTTNSSSRSAVSSSAGEGFPQAHPVTREEFDDYWIARSSVVSVARFGGYLIGGYYIKPNYVGRASHIANAGYFVLGPYRSTGVGRTLVEHSLRTARRLGFDAMQFNLVFESNSARTMYAKLGFAEVGRIPARSR